MNFSSHAEAWILIQSVPEERVLRRIFGCKGKEITEDYAVKSATTCEFRKILR